MWERACSGRRSDEGGVSGDINIDWAAVFASKPAPTGSRDQPGIGNHNLNRAPPSGDASTVSVPP